MPFKTIHLEDIGEVKLYKRRGARHIKLAITSEGEARVTMPFWAPYHMGMEFARSKADWIRQQQPAKVHLTQGLRIGRGYTLNFEPSDVEKVKTRIRNGQIIITHPVHLADSETTVQQAAHKASLRALKAEAQRALPKRLNELAEQHGFDYHSIRIKQLKGRWGSCNQNKDIVLNCYLMQLPQELIDYVIVHELVHTHVMAHGQPFWAEVGRYVVDLPALRKTIRTYQPRLIGNTGSLLN